MKELGSGRSPVFDRPGQGRALHHVLSSGFQWVEMDRCGVVAINSSRARLSHPVFRWSVFPGLVSGLLSPIARSASPAGGKYERDV